MKNNLKVESRILNNHSGFREWRIASKSRKKVVHAVSLNDGVFSCTCEAFKYRRREIGNTCKHIAHIKKVEYYNKESAHAIAGKSGLNKTMQQYPNVMRELD